MCHFQSSLRRKFVLINCSNITFSECAIHLPATQGRPLCFASLAASALLSLHFAIKSQDLILSFPSDEQNSLLAGITMRVIIWDFLNFFISLCSQYPQACQQTTKVATGPPSGDKAANCRPGSSVTRENRKMALSLVGGETGRGKCPQMFCKSRRYLRG